MHIKVLGPMIKPVDVLVQNASIAAKRLKCKATVEKVTDFSKAIAYGAFALPVLVIDEKVVAYGSVLPVEEIMAIMKNLNY